MCQQHLEPKNKYFQPDGLVVACQFLPIMATEEIPHYDIFFTGLNGNKF